MTPSMFDVAARIGGGAGFAWFSFHRNGAVVVTRKSWNLGLLCVIFKFFRVFFVKLSGLYCGVLNIIPASQGVCFAKKRCLSHYRVLLYSTLLCKPFM
jgi:hypothetical protein